MLYDHCHSRTSVIIRDKTSSWKNNGWSTRWWQRINLLTWLWCASKQNSPNLKESFGRIIRMRLNLLFFLVFLFMYISLKKHTNIIWVNIFSIYELVSKFVTSKSLSIVIEGLKQPYNFNVRLWNKILLYNRPISL